jgi:hypothetical protein
LSRGQAVTFDVMIAITFFLLVIFSSYYFWFNLLSDSVNKQKYYERESAIDGISDLLVQTGGSPADWDLNSSDFIGLCDQPNLVNITKFTYLSSLVGVNDSLSSTLSDSNYETLKEKLGVPGFGLYLTLSNLTSGLEIDVSGRGAIGLYPYNSTEVSSRQRVVLFGNSTQNRTRMTIMVYET